MKNQTKISKSYIPAIIMVLLFLASTAMASDYKTVVSNEGGVRVDVIPLQLANRQAARFEVRLNTHSVPLEQDLAAISVLRDDQGREYKPVQWEGDPPGGHHREGVLVFPELAAPLNSVTLTISSVANVASREFTWKLNQ